MAEHKKFLTLRNIVGGVAATALAVNLAGCADAGVQIPDTETCSRSNNTLTTVAGIGADQPYEAEFGALKLVKQADGQVVVYKPAYSTTGTSSELEAITLGLGQSYTYVEPILPGLQIATNIGYSVGDDGTFTFTFSESCG